MSEPEASGRHGRIIIQNGTVVTVDADNTRTPLQPPRR
jgi:hypothetical protein